MTASRRGEIVKSISWVSLMSLLADVATRKRAWRELRLTFARKHAPDFNVFEFLRADEIGLSGVIRWMLDPGGSHGQGDAFLRAFCVTFGIKQQFATDCAVAETEFATHAIAANRRRIDVHVQCGDFILAIENKPYAGWQRRQVADYLDHLEEAAGGRHCLVLLKGDAGPVPADQLAAADAGALIREGRLIDSDYGELGKWVRACADLCEAARVCAVLGDFADHLEWEFGKGIGTDENLFLVDALRSEPERLRSALDLIAAGQGLLDSIFNDFVREVGRAAERRGWTATDEIPAGRAGLDSSSTACNILFGDSPFVFAFGVHYEAGAPYFGLRWRTRATGPALSAEVTARLNRVLGGPGRAEATWPWWRWLGPGDVEGVDVEDFSSVWSAMNDKTVLAERLIAWAAAAHEALQT
jgi:hypothetical protein